MRSGCHTWDNLGLFNKESLLLPLQKPHQGIEPLHIHATLVLSELFIGIQPICFKISAEFANVYCIKLKRDFQKAHKREYQIGYALIRVFSSAVKVWRRSS
jgi:hypothetical protein